jgi:hypothetical protein
MAPASPRTTDVLDLTVDMRLSSSVITGIAEEKIVSVTDKSRSESEQVFLAKDSWSESMISSGVGAICEGKVVRVWAE